MNRTNTYRISRLFHTEPVKSSKTVLPKVSAAYEKLNMIAGKKITHLGYKLDDERQKYVQYAYDVGGLDLVTLIECENGQRKTDARGDGGDAIGLCQMNTNYHKLPADYYKDRMFQVEYCDNKRVGGTVFYGPTRMIKGVRCSTYVLDRFKIE